MNSRAKGPSLGWISLVGILLGVAAWIGLGVGSPLQPKSAPSATPETAPTTAATQPTWLLPTLPVFNWSDSPLQGSSGVVGAQAPDFELTDLAGNLVKLSNLKGTAVVINFWASWCPPCRDEMPELQSLAADYAPQELIVLGVNATYADSRSEAEKFADDLNIQFPILLDESGAVTEQAYGVFGLPATFWVDRQGIIRFINVGPMTKEDMLKTAENLLQP